MKKLLPVVVSCLIVAFSLLQGGELPAKSYDLIVVGGTPGGIACAVRAAREGLKVLLVNHTGHIGGFITSGAGGWEAPYDGFRSPVYAEILEATAEYYKKTYGENSPQHILSQPSKTSNAHIDRPKVEPRVAEMLFEEMVAREKNLTVLKGHYISGATRKGTQIETITLKKTGGGGEAIEVAGRIFADCMYEGDLMALAGAKFQIGRESHSQYGEPHAGVIYATERPKPPGQPGFPDDAVKGRLNIRYNSHATGDLLPQSTGEGDGSVMAYNYRLILTNDPKNRVPIAKPANYDPNASGKVSSGSYVPGLPNVIVDKPNVVPNLPNQKVAWNGGRLIGPQNRYPAGDWKEREHISRLYLDTMLSLLWYYQNDPAAPEVQRQYWKEYGLAADEFVDNNHLPHEIYVREARRLVGRHIFTEHDAVLAEGRLRTPIQYDSIAITDWPVDSVACLPRGFEGGHQDGVFFLAEEARPAQIPYRSLLAREIDNLLVPVALSASHVGWGPIRLEPVWMQTGEAAGVAAALAIKKGVAPAAVDTDLLLKALVTRGFMISFFNDVLTDSGQSWVPAVEFFGTKGFFDSYDARPADALTAATASVWSATFGKLAAGEKFDPNEVAGQLCAAAADQPKILVSEYAELLKGELSRRGRETEPVNGAAAAMGLKGDSILNRAGACELAFKVLLP